MVTRNADSSHQQGDGTVSSAHPVSAEQLRSHAGSTVNGLSASGADNTVFKSGPLLVSSKGIGWTSWKKRWFILTRTSLVFFRSDPSVAPQRGSEANLTLGGIDLNNSASVVVRADKKLLTVLFPDGRDGRAFTLKAETSEDMHEWKTALEAALAQAPGATATLAVEQSGIFQNDSADAIEGSFEQWRDKRPVKSSVIGRPVLLALEDADGSPSFLEKALRFVEQYGVKVEGILRQSADVDEVEHRVQEYEQGKNEFSPDEDAHLVVDCIKHVLRELPYSPVPASCCTSLLEAFRTGHGSRVNALHNTISRTFPEPNRRLLHRILKMMRTVVYHKSENRMSTSAVAACMAPLLLRPLLAGDCEVENDFNMGGDGSLQLLRAAAAANHAQAIVITLLEEYSNIFLDGSFSPDLCSESEGSGSEYEGSTDDEALDDDVYDDAEDDIDGETEDDHECALSGSLSDNNGDVGSELDDNEVLEDIDSEPKSPKVDKDFKAGENLTKETHDPILRQQNIKSSDDMQSLNNHSSAVECCEPVGNAPNPTSPKLKSTSLSPSSCIPKSTTKSNDPAPTVKRRTIWGRTAAKKNLSMESIEFPCEDEMEIQRLETIKVDLKTKITVEANGNEILQGSLERRKQAMLEQRLALEQDVARLEDQLQRERNLRATLEAGVNMPLEHLSIPSNVDSKIRAEIEETVLAEAEVSSLKQKVADLHVQIDQQREHTYGSVCESCGRPLPTSNQQTTRMAQQKDTGSTPAHERFSASEDALPGEGLPTQVLLPISNNHPPKERDSTDQNCTKSTGASTFLSPDCDRVITQDPPFSKQQSPKKQHPIANTPSGSLSVRTQVLPSSSENQSPQKQHPDSTGTSDFSGASLSVKAQASMSSSDNQGPQKLHPDSTGTTDLSGGSLNVKSRASPSSSDNQGPQKQHPDSTGTTDLSGGSLTVKSRASLSSSEKQGPQKQHPDSTGTTSNLSSGYPSVETRAPLSASENQAPQRQQQDSTGINTNLSRSSLSVKTRAPLSSSENQALQKQQREKTLQNGTKFDGTMTSLASYRESVATQEPPSFSGKQPNHKQQPDSPYPNRNKFGGATTSSMTEFEKVVAQCPPSLSDKQFPYNQQPDSTSKNNKSKGATTGSLSEEPLKVGITASKKSAGKGEGTASAPYAMTRLTNLLNYMKERRSLVDEIQNQDASNTRVSEGPLLSRPPETHSR